MRGLPHELEPARLAAEARRLRKKYLRKLRRVDRKVVRLQPTGNPRGRALLSYIVDPLLDPEREIEHSHTHYWESMTMARILVEQGWAVDAISWTNLGFQPSCDYDLVIDVRLNLERLAPLVGPACVKLLHSDTAHWSVHNAAQEARYRALEERRGVSLLRHKQLPENRAIEHADLCTYLGNDFTRATYAFAGKPMFRIPVSVPFQYPWADDKDFEAVRRRFLWFGSGGLVHKGLDLVLEAFAGLDGFELIVAGPIQHERDFERTYAGELYRTPNIRTLGWVDTHPDHFPALAAQCLGLVYPSCSEGGGSSALTCMHAGLVPLITPQTSVDLTPERGVLLREASIEGIREAVRELSSRPVTQSRELARAAWEWSRAHHTRERWAEHYRDFARTLTDGSWRERDG